MNLKMTCKLVKVKLVGIMIELVYEIMIEIRGQEKPLSSFKNVLSFLLIQFKINDVSSKECKT